MFISSSAATVRSMGDLCGSNLLRAVAVAVLVVSTLALAGCGSGSSTGAHSGVAKVVHGRVVHGLHKQASEDVYRADAASDLSPVVRHDPALVYVPNSLSNTVDVISQETMKVIRRFPTGALPQHVTPSYDLKTLYVDNDEGNSLTPINPRTG